MKEELKMTSQNYKDIKRVVYISSNIGQSCEHCTFQIDGVKLAESINHYIEHHGYKILHVGTETTHSDATEGLWHSTVAVLGI